MIKMVNLTSHALYLHIYIYFHIKKKLGIAIPRNRKEQAVPESLQNGCFFLSYVNLTAGN